MDGRIMKIGELVIQENTKEIKLIIEIESLLFAPSGNKKPYTSKILYFHDGSKDWAMDWRKITWKGEK